MNFPYKTLSGYLGDDLSFPLLLEPPQSVVGMTFQWKAAGLDVQWQFPPVTELPLSWPWRSELSFLDWVPQPLAVFPGQIPVLPVGSAPTLLVDNALVGNLTIVDASVGSFLVTIPAGLMAGMKPQGMTWWLRRIDAGHNQVYQWGGLDLLPSFGPPT